MRCLFFDCPVTVGVERPTTKTLNLALRAVGGNTGNLLFRHGIASSVVDELIPCHWSEGQDLAREQNFDAVILGAANWLNTYHDNGNDKRARIIRELNKPTICIGLGIQHSERTSKKLVFPDATIAFLNALRELQATVLVRDEFTYDQCLLYGLSNVAVIGCPSSFINLSQSQVDALLSRPGDGSLFSKIALNHGYLRRDIRKHDSALISSVQETNGLYIVQDNLNGEIELALASEGPVDLSIRTRLRRLFTPSSNDSVLNPRLLSAGVNLRAYFNALEWIENLKSCSVVLGTRIHGCIAALQAGTPSVITTIDSRTAGLAETLGIPRVALSRLDISKRKLNPTALVDKTGVDFNPYIRRRQYLLSTYIKHLRGFGLTPSPRLFEVTC
jgi:hypothetical protein